MKEKKTTAFKINFLTNKRITAKKQQSSLLYEYSQNIKKALKQKLRAQKNVFFKYLYAL